MTPKALSPGDRNSCSCGAHKRRQLRLLIQGSSGPRSMTMAQLPGYAAPRPHRRQLVSLPSRSHDACGPTFGCAVYVGHATIFQLHRLSILKGKRFCNESNACLSLELGAREGSSVGAACPPSPFCTVTWWMYAVVPSSSWITCPSSSFSPTEMEMEKWARPRKGLKTPACF